MGKIICEECGKEFDDTNKVCPNCGYERKSQPISNTKIEKSVIENVGDENTNICLNCGSILKEGETFCSKCGTEKRS